VFETPFDDTCTYSPSAGSLRAFRTGLNNSTTGFQSIGGARAFGSAFDDNTYSGDEQSSGSASGDSSLLVDDPSNPTGRYEMFYEPGYGGPFFEDTTAMKKAGRTFEYHQAGLVTPKKAGRTFEYHQAGLVTPNSVLAMPPARPAVTTPASSSLEPVGVGRRRIEFSGKEYLGLAGIVVRVNPFGAKHGTKGAKWEEVAKECKSNGWFTTSSTDVIKNKALALIKFQEVCLQFIHLMYCVLTNLSLGA
jgi:hypothetical protein